MKKRILYGTNKLVEEITSNFQKIDVIDGGWTIKYKDLTTGDLWIKYVIDTERGYFFNLMRIDPAPSADKLIDIAMTSHYIDEVSAAINRLRLDSDSLNFDFKGNLISRVKQIDLNSISEFEISRIETIIEAGELTNRINTRAIVGKKIADINSDYRIICQMGDEAELIINQLKELKSTAHNKGSNPS